ncbi:Sua5/YciO/YrdC/YwlC family protein [Ectothiorhodospira lacustris]|uniref:Sua5/YciO/YrdC/YwlC family protein n=1 Tax=Ectothiorhodospira lacustris TaxID=2899127 RepID=UPI001EE8E45F|nr:Sua5/YciO/YrdC/YwlC family protein [Ectothiorhodospira lacustris]MCG5502014.1 Sua5/YciO/YrdC/YwlC family protein [Ectothiorhodospira lacustris]MCG5509163.1 Sua5/YciO/YrdC/YwlC family protein [Ectothiorhodospira lacustris]MCG5520953.1 Sua5/YciO/YrdC/YwlC family protein [Ectothiorhodospira lacustris]
MNRRLTDIADAAALIRGGGVIAYPTEAVFGLGCDPRNEIAVHRLLQIKRRLPDQGLILIGADFVQLAPFLRPVDARLQVQAMATWPGPHTWLWPARPDAPRWLTGVHDTLAVRITDHPLAAALCRAADMALVSTSANLSGQPPGRDADTVNAALGELLDGILEGPTGGREHPSEIRDLQTGRQIRGS